MRKIILKVTPKITRLDLFLSHEIKNLSRSQVKKLINEGNIQVNDRLVDPSYKPTKGDSVTVVIPSPKSTEVKAEEIPLKIIYEDKDLLVVDKDANMVTHPTLDHPSGTLVNALLHHVRGIPEKGESIRPGIVHRLDKGTSGLLVIAKNQKTLESLKRQFKERSVIKKYVCLVSGRVKKSSGMINAPISRHPVNRRKFTVSEEGKEAATKYNVLKTISDKVSLLELEPKTGRTHQIRVHLSHLGHPIIGDKLYGGKAVGKRQFLHSSYLEFTHPSKGNRVKFESSLPSDLQNILSKLEKNLLK